MCAVIPATEVLVDFVCIFRVFIAIGRLITQALSRLPFVKAVDFERGKFPVGKAHTNTCVRSFSLVICGEHYITSCVIMRPTTAHAEHMFLEAIRPTLVPSSSTINKPLPQCVCVCGNI